MSFVLQLLHVFTLCIITHSQNYMYHGSTYQLSHSDWEATCLFYYDTHLASIHDNSQQVEAFTATGGAKSWIGAEDYSVAEDIWVWTDGTDFDYGTTYFTLPWAPDEPNDYGIGEDCAEIDQNGEWNDIHCDELKYGLCAYPQPNPIIDDGASDVRSRQHPGYAGPIDILDEIYIDFYITFTSWPTGWGNILHFGNSDADRFPAVFVYGPTGMIQTTFATVATALPAIETTPSPALQLNTEYHYTLYQTQRSLKVTFGVNDSYVYEDIYDYATGSGESHPIIMNQDMYLGSDWHDDFDATIRNLVVTTANSPETTFWNYICDWDDRFTERSGTWSWAGIGSGIDGDCSVRQTDTANEIRIAWMGEKDPDSLLWADYNIEVIMNLISGNYMGIIFRATGQDCGTPDYCGDAYYLKMGTSGYEFAQLNGAYNLLNTYSKSHSVNTPYLVRVECVGNTFKIYEANKYLVTWTDSSYAVGSVGLRTLTSDGRFSKLRITFPEKEKLECPAGSTQQGTINADLLGCGMEACEARYTQATIDECFTHCSNTAGCRSFNWAPLGGDEGHLDQRVCNIYSELSPDQIWGPYTIFCRKDTDSPTDNPTSNPTSNPTLATAAPTLSTTPPSNAPTTPPSNAPSISPTTPPTQTPSISPSVAPNSAPSMAPSHAPTSPPSNVPSVAPTTSVPSTLVPTKYPSKSPSKAPTFAEQEQEQRETTIYSTGNDYESNIAANQKGSNSGLYIAVIIIVICFVFGVAALFFYKFWKKKQRNISMTIKDRVSSMSDVEIVNVKSSGDDGVVMADINETCLDIMHNSGDNNDSDLVEIINKTDMGMINMSDDDKVAVDNDVLEMVNSTDFGIMDNLHHVDVVETDGGYIDVFVIDDLSEKQTIGNEPIIQVDSNENNFIIDDFSAKQIVDTEPGTMPKHAENNLIEGIDYDINEDGAKEIYVWLDSIGLLRYYDMFIQNGFDSLEMVQEINNENVLNRIGVTLLAHQVKIINHIKKIGH